MGAMREFDLLIEAGKMVSASNQEVLKKDTMQASDAKQYLLRHLEMGRIIEESGLPLLARRIREVNDRLRGAIDMWDSDRSECLFHLLHLVNSDRKQGMIISMEASAQCVQALLLEPLIPDLDKEKFSDIVGISQISLNEVMTKPSNLPLLDLYRTYAAGIQWNAIRFRPEIFSVPATEAQVKGGRDLFLSNLSALQGMSPYVQ